MSAGNDRDRAVIGRLVAELAGRCRFCGCEGETCTTTTGEKCVLSGALEDRCNGVPCEIAWANAQWAAKRGRRRRGRAA